MPNFGIRHSIYSMERDEVLRYACGRSMVSMGSIHNVFDLCMDVQKNKVPGCFVETGIWQGGCVIAMAYAAIRFAIVSGQKGNGPLCRKTWGFDSFEGLPAITEEDGDPGYKEGALAISIENVDSALYWTFRLRRDNVFLVKGWFDTTLPRCKDDMGPIAVLRLDGDWYKSTMDALVNLYDQVSVGGWVIIDDYCAWPGCRKAANDFFKSRGWLPEDFVNFHNAPWLDDIPTGGMLFQKTQERV